MPSFFFFCSTVSPNSPAQMPHDATSITNPRRSLFVTISARALGSVGFGLSILAIWVRWIWPSKESTVVSVPQRRQRLQGRRRSVPSRRLIPVATTLNRRHTLPIVSPPAYHDELSRRSRRVYFLDSPRPIDSGGASGPLIQAPLDSARPPAGGDEPSSTSPSSSSTLVANNGSSADKYEESIAESDSSRQSSISSLSRIKRPFSGKSRHKPGALETIPSASPLQPDVLSARPDNQLSMVHTANGQPTKPTSAHLPFRRHSSAKTTTPTASPSHSTDSVASSCHSYFSSKKSRRSSAPVPVPRTSPYEAPYFAAPPIAPPPRKRSSLQRPYRKADENTKPETNLGKAVTRAHTDLGPGHPKSPPKHRSASGTWLHGRPNLHS